MKKVFTFGLLFSAVFCFSQSKSAADKYFKNFHYVKSAEVYEKIYHKGDSSQLVISRIADSYYFNSKSVKSEFWYEKLFTIIPEEEIPSEYYFRYAQSLKSNKKYQDSDKWLLKFREKSSEDSRGEKITTNRNYLEEYTRKRKKIITLHNVAANTPYSDFGVAMYNNTLFFSSSRPDSLNSEKQIYSWNNQPYLDIYKAEQSESKGNEKDQVIYNIIQQEKLADVNTKYHDANAIITKDGMTMYFTRDNYLKKLKSDKKGTVHLKLYKAENIDGKWENIIELPFNSDDYSIGHPSLSPDEKTLYFVSDMPGSIGQTDIYKIAILSDGTYGDPINLGNTINTEGKELFPFLSSDNTLYFSSDGHLGLGALDIFSSKNSNGVFENIKNIGSPFNSAKDDFGFVIDSLNEYGYISSNREGGKGDDDIYSFTIREPEIPCTQKIVGTVINTTTGELLPNTLITLSDAQGKLIKSFTVGLDAAFEFEASCNTTYTILGEKDYFVADEQKLATENKIGITTTKLQLSLSDEFKVENGNLLININPIYFDLNKSNIRPDAALELDKVVAIMKKYPNVIIESGSHTDSRGSDLYNEKLSDRRAKSTVKYIVSKGISPNRISGKGYGETKPVNKCVNGVWCNEQTHQLNRRTEFLIVRNKK